MTSLQLRGEDLLNFRNLVNLNFNFANLFSTLKISTYFWQNYYIF